MDLYRAIQRNFVPKVAVVFKQFKRAPDSLKLGIEVDITLDLNSKVQKYFEGNILHNGKTLDSRENIGFAINLD
jgi:hypothetical protein